MSCNVLNILVIFCIKRYKKEILKIDYYHFHIKIENIKSIL